MTVRTKEEDVPSEFPPARLFLDDIEEIVRIFQEFVQKREIEGHSRIEDLRMTVTFSVGDQECDDVQDLCKIAKSGRKLSIKVSRGDWVSTSIRFLPWLGTFWASWGNTKHDTWSAFHQLQPLFKKRNLRWRTLFHSGPWWRTVIVWPLAFWLLVPFLRFLLYRFMSHAAADTILLLIIVVIVVTFVGGFRHTTIVFRHSWDQSPFRQYMKDKLIPVIVGFVLGVAGTVLTQYLGHKFWP